MLVFCRRGRLPPPLSSFSLSPSQHDRQNLAKANRDSSNFFTCFGCFGLQNRTIHFSQALTPKPSEYLHCVHHTSLSQGKCWFMYFSLLLCGYKCNKNIWYLSSIAVKNMGYSMFWLPFIQLAWECEPRKSPYILPPTEGVKHSYHRRTRCSNSKCHGNMAWKSWRPLHYTITYLLETVYLITNHLI